MFAMQARAPEFELGEDEAKYFLRSAQNVLRHYSVETTQKTIDIVTLCGVSMQVFGTRVVAYSVRRRQEAGGRRGPAEVVNFPGSAGAAHTPYVAPDFPEDFAG